MWIQRTLESRFSARPLQGSLPVWLLLGPRQVGKSSLILHCKEQSRQYINLDDLQTRTRATTDPELFVRELAAPLAIDEIQYAPQILSAVKMLADRSDTPGSIWLTGSQSFEVMKGVQETLAGRVALIELYGLSDEEKKLTLSDPAHYFSRIIDTGFPRLQGIGSAAERSEFLDSYVRTYIERDVRELLGIQKRREFEIFLRICALRTAQVVNYDSMAADIGVSPKTVKEWLSLLADSYLIALVPPYYTNRTKRLIKNPKIYFLDMGLAAFLAGWQDSEMLRLGPLGGAALETHVFGNLLRYFRNRCQPAEITFWRTRDGKEIDFLIETNGKVIPIEVKTGIPATQSLQRLSLIRDARWTDGWVLSLAADCRRVRLSEEWSLAHVLDINAPAMSDSLQAAVP